MSKKRVIVVTDGDLVAGRTVQVAARNIGARFISLTTGNPTPILGSEVVNLIKQTPSDLVVIMVDDKGKNGPGKGETVFKHVAEDPDIDVIGAVAVASNTAFTEGVKVDCSVTCEGAVIDGPVNKLGIPERKGHKFLEGDTVDIINNLDIPVVIGTGDTGKMDFADDYHKGAPITTKALLEILNRSEKDK
ncbi:stage V sporulation protein AE [Phosphitispora sp. TUW77]|uniref:stage V sporulation protein AE n=1 Tax=Phosphitispora sp. TUW77 TaxID=3152361 RepID=UPI003AB16632